MVPPQILHKPTGGRLPPLRSPPIPRQPTLPRPLGRGGTRSVTERGVKDGRQITVPYNFRKIRTKSLLRPIYNRYLYTRARQKTVRPQEIVVEQGGLPSCPQHLVKSSIYRITVRKIGISLVKIFLKKVLTLHLTYCRIMEHACEKTGELRPFSGTQDCTICVEAGGCSRRAGYFRGVCPISNRAKK